MRSTRRLRIALLIVIAQLALTCLPGVGSPATARAQFDFGKNSDPWDAREQQFGFSSRSVVKPDVAHPDRVVAGGRLPVAVILDLKPGWHIWTNDRPLDSPMIIWDGATLTEITAKIDDAAGIKPFFDRIIWPEAHPYRTDFGDGMSTYGVFEERAVMYLPVLIDADAPVGETSFEIMIDFQACDANGCKAPDSETITVNVEIVPAGASIEQIANADLAKFPMAIFDDIDPDAAPPAITPDTDVEGGSGTAGGAAAPAAVVPVGFIGFLGLMAVAVIGGLLLNFTPCVLPVIPIKIMGLVQSGHGSRGRTFALGAAMAVGVIGFWMALGVLVTSLNNFSTNQLFQWPAFPISIGLIVGVLAIGMIGAFTIGLPQSVYRFNPSHDTLHGSVLFGVMAAVLSTPCTAPFMGGAITASVGQPKVVVLSVFFAIGLGMAIPYLLLAANPKWIDKMPRTGPASELLKQVLGLIMLAVAAYFIGIGISGYLQKPGLAPSRAYWYVVGGTSIAAGVWLLVRTFQITPAWIRRIVFSTVAIIMMGVGGFFAVEMTKPGPIEWVYYTPERLEQELAAGHPVMLKFTAEWCANCHLLERTVVDRDEVIQRIAKTGVVPMKVDITSRNAIGNDLLNEYWKSIPYLVIQRPDHSVAFKSDWYTVNDLLGGLDAAVSTPVAMK
ncbi:MAG: thioredoxin family protein [Phycisphaerales bacterium]|nr:thioredoxin family protein [Phycisphaerales bacterium]